MRPLIQGVLLFSQILSPSVAQQTKAEGHEQKGLQFARQNNLNGAETELRLAVQAAPSNPAYLASLGAVLGMERKLEESRDYLEKALKLDSSDIAIRRNLASDQFQMGMLTDARRNLQHILTLKPGDPATVLLLGMVANREKQYRTAVALLESVRRLVLHESQSIIALASAYYGVGDRENARRTLSYLQILPDRAPAIAVGAELAANDEDFETAERLFTVIKSTYPRPEVIGYKLALVQYRAGRVDQSEQTLLALIADGHRSVDVYNLLAWCYHRKGRSADAMHAFDLAIDQVPKTESDYLQLGTALERNKLLPAALVVAQRAVPLAPNSAELYKLKGRVELDLQLYIDAVKSYTRALQIDANSAEADLGLALALWGTGAISRATTTFEQGLKRFPRDPSHYIEYARLLLKLKETRERDFRAESRAISLLETVSRIDRSQSEPHYLIGNSLLRQGQDLTALRELQTAERLDSKSSKIHFALSRAYRRLGRSDEADKELQTYTKLKAEEDARL